MNMLYRPSLCGLWRWIEECGTIRTASKTSYLKKKSRIGVATAAGCSTVTMEVTMLLFSTGTILSRNRSNATYSFVIPHNYVDRVRLAGGAA